MSAVSDLVPGYGTGRPASEVLQSTTFNGFSDRPPCVTPVVRNTAEALAVKDSIPVTLADAENVVRTAAWAWMDAIRGRLIGATENPPPAAVLRATPGVGKSRAAMMAVAEAGADMEIWYVVPEHALGAELAARYDAIAATIPGAPPSAVLRGRSAPAPDVGPPGPDGAVPRMCDRHKDAEAVARLGLPVATSLCLDPRRGVACPHHPTSGGSCPYIRQLAYPRASVRFLAHNWLFLPPPEGLPKPDAVIIDEGFWPRALREQKVTLDAIRRRREFQHGRRARERSILMAKMADSAAAALRTAFEAGMPLSARHFADQGITVRKARLMAGLVARSAPRVEIHPGQPVEKQRRLLMAIPVAEEPAVARFWSLLADELAAAPGRDRLHAIEPAPIKSEAGVVPGLTLRWSADLAAHVARVPILLLDGTADHEIVRRFLPHATPPVAAIAPIPRHVEVIQVTDRAVSMDMLLEKPGGVADQNQRRARRRRDLHRVVEAEADGGRRAILSIVYKDMLSAMQAMGPLDGVTWVAHGATRGRDTWGEVDGIVVAGRMQPPPRTLETQAEALFYKDPRPILRLPENAYTKTTVDLDTIPGLPKATVTIDTHPDPLVAAVLRQVREAELHQEVHRARPVRRGPGRPMRIVVATAVPAGIPVTQTTTWDGLVLNVLRLLRVRGVVPLWWDGLARAHPDLFPSGQAARDAIRKSVPKTVNSPMDDLHREFHSFAAIRILPAGSRRRQTVLVDLDRHADPMVVIETAIGKFELASPTTEPRASAVGARQRATRLAS